MEKTVSITPKTALITGGASGLGKDLCLLLLDKGYYVIVFDRIQSHRIAPDFLAQINKYVEVDLSDLTDVKRVIHESIVDYDKVGILIINAFTRVFKDYKDFEDHEIIAFANASFVSQLLLVNTILNKMLTNGFGRIITISSKSAIRGYSSGSLYCSIKAAWLTIHDSLAKELYSYQKNVHITTICPDSISNIDGARYQHYEFIMKSIRKIVLQSLEKPISRVYFPVTMKSKITLSLQLYQQFINIWK